MLPRLLVGLAFVFLVGCGEGGDTSGSEAANGETVGASTTGARRPGHDSAEGLIAHLVSIGGAESRPALYDLVVTKNKVEEMTVGYGRSIDRWRLRMHDLVNEIFELEGDQRWPMDLGMDDVLAQLEHAPLVPDGQSRVKVSYEDADGATQTLTLMRQRGAWYLHPSSLRGGEPVSETWYSMQQFEFMLELKTLRDTVAQLENDVFESAEAVRKAYDDAMDGAPPAMGTVQPDEGDA